jgi:hypothetical protein
MIKTGTEIGNLISKGPKSLAITLFASSTHPVEDNPEPEPPQINDEENK